MCSDTEQFLEKAQTILEKNPHYAFLLAQSVLEQDPGNTRARTLLHTAHNRRPQRRFSKDIIFFTCKILSFFIHKPTLQLRLADTALLQKPDNLWALRLLACSAERLQLFHTACTALESMLTQRGVHEKDKLKLCSIYLTLNETEKAINLSEKIFKENPNCIEALNISRQASVKEALR